MTLTDHFLADGIDEVAFVFEFLPDCVANVAGQQKFPRRFKAPILPRCHKHSMIECIRVQMKASLWMLRTVAPKAMKNPIVTLLGLLEILEELLGFLGNVLGKGSWLHLIEEIIGSFLFGASQSWQLPKILMILVQPFSILKSLVVLPRFKGVPNSIRCAKVIADLAASSSYEP